MKICGNLRNLRIQSPFLGSYSIAARQRAEK